LFYYIFVLREGERYHLPGKSVWCPGSWSPFFETDILNFKKNLKKYKDVVSYVQYKRVNFYYGILCIATSAKKTKWIKVGTCSQIWIFVIFSENKI
jgi:hypothetical protein